MAQYDDINAGVITVVGFVSVVITFVTIIAGQVLYFQFQGIETKRKYAAYPQSEGQTILSNQEETLNNFTWLDRDKGIVSQPIEQSMKSVLTKLKSPEK